MQEEDHVAVSANKVRLCMGSGVGMRCQRILLGQGQNPANVNIAPRKFPHLHCFLFSKHRSFPLSTGDSSKTPSGCWKPQIGLNPTHAVFSYSNGQVVFTPSVRGTKIHLQLGHHRTVGDFITLLRTAPYFKNLWIGFSGTFYVMLTAGN